MLGLCLGHPHDPIRSIRNYLVVLTEQLWWRNWALKTYGLSLDSSRVLGLSGRSYRIDAGKIPGGCDSGIDIFAINRRIYNLIRRTTDYAVILISGMSSSSLLRQGSLSR